MNDTRITGGRYVNTKKDGPLVIDLKFKEKAPVGGWDVKEVVAEEVIKAQWQELPDYYLPSKKPAVVTWGSFLGLIWVLFKANRKSVHKHRVTIELPIKWF